MRCEVYPGFNRSVEQSKSANPPTKILTGGPEECFLMPEAEVLGAFHACPHESAGGGIALYYSPAYFSVHSQSFPSLLDFLHY